jgi:glycosyltransferase involved in cell wall biosynthesis
LERELSSLDRPYEIIVVDDGGGDIDRARLERRGSVRVITYPRNRGKGAAVRAGMLAADGQVRVYTDADIPYGTRPIVDIMGYILDRGFHAVIGDRTLRGSAYVEPPLGRRALSYVASGFIGRLVTGGFFDTQCGLKAFRGDVADELFKLVRVERFAFDVEVIYLCLKYRLDIKRIPVRLETNSTSSVRLIRDSTRGMVDLFRIKIRQSMGVYYSSKLEGLISEEYDHFRSR